MCQNTCCFKSLSVQQRCPTAAATGPGGRRMLAAVPRGMRYACKSSSKVVLGFGAAAVWGFGDHHRTWPHDDHLTWKMTFNP